jgi:hypothetical protein
MLEHVIYEIYFRLVANKMKFTILNELVVCFIYLFIFFFFQSITLTLYFIIITQTFQKASSLLNINTTIHKYKEI